MPAEDDYNIFAALAERMGLSDEESEQYITEHMKRLGYKMRTAWDEPEGDGNNTSSMSFFKDKNQRERRTIEPRQRRASGDSGGSNSGFYR